MQARDRRRGSSYRIQARRRERQGFVKAVLTQPFRPMAFTPQKIEHATAFLAALEIAPDTLLEVDTSGPVRAPPQFVFRGKARIGRAPQCPGDFGHDSCEVRHDRRSVDL